MVVTNNAIEHTGMSLMYLVSTVLTSAALLKDKEKQSGGN